MTITVAPARSEYTANAGQTIFNYTFKIFEDTNLNVYVTPAGQVANDSTDLTTAYTVTGLGDEDGGTITLTTPTSQDDLVTIVSNVPSSRTIDYQNNGDFRPNTVNNDFDRVVSIAKKIEDQANRSLLLEQSQQEPKPLSLPNPVAQRYLRWRNDLSGVENAALSDLDPVDLDEFLINDLSQEYYFASISEYKSSAIVFPAGKAIRILFGRACLFTVIAGTGTADEYSIVASSVVDQSIQLAETGDLHDHMFGAIGDNINDDTLPLQAFIDYGIQNKQRMFLGGNNYKITDTLNANNECYLRGVSPINTFINLTTSSSATPCLIVDIGDNESVIGTNIGGFTMNCGAGVSKGIGLRIQTTPTNSAISLSVFSDIQILNVSIGVSMTGVIYMSTFRNITVSGSIEDYGWFATSPQEIIYCSFEDLEVTNVGDDAYAYYFQTAACHWRNITADGCIYLASPYGNATGVTIEGIPGAANVSNNAIELNQLQTLNNVAMINIPNVKCGVGIFSLGENQSISEVRFPDAGAGNQPNLPILYDANSTGTLQNVMMENCVTRMTQATLASVTATSCEDVTDFGADYKTGTWTPTFPGWSTAPSVISAQWTKIGRITTVTLYCNNGVCAASDTIGGLPFAANSTQGAAGAGASSDTTKVISGSILPSSSVIGNLPANNLTGNFWQMTATYFT